VSTNNSIHPTATFPCAAVQFLLVAGAAHSSSGASRTPSANQIGTAVAREKKRAAASPQGVAACTFISAFGQIDVCSVRFHLTELHLHYGGFAPSNSTRWQRDQLI